MPIGRQAEATRKKVSSPHLGSYTKIVHQAALKLGWEFIPPANPSKRTVELGVKYMNELMCYPAKVTLGSMIEGCEKGATDLLMFDSCGQCRLKTYWILQQQVLRQLGYNVRVNPLRLGGKSVRDIRAIDPSVTRWRGWNVFIRALLAIKRLDEQQSRESSQDPCKINIGVVGEIYSILEPTVNMQLFQKLRSLNVTVHNSLPLSRFVFKSLWGKLLLKREDMDEKLLKEAKRLVHPYFPHDTIGGHGKDSIIHTVYYALKKYDGVVHVLPFPCMPEATAAAIVDSISEDYGIPVLRLVFDEHSGEAGLETRLEAFVDILQSKRTRIGGGF